MTTDTIVEKKADFDLVAVVRAVAPEARERRFWITLAVALTLHGLILISLIHSAPRQMGDPNAAPGAVSVSFVSEAELLDSTTGADGGGATPAPQPTPTPPPQAVQPPPEPQAQPAPAEPAVQPPPAPEPKPPAEPAEAAQPKAEQLAKAEETKAPETPTLRDSVAGEAAPEKKAEESEAAKAKEAEKEAKLDPEKPVETPSELTKERPDLLELPHNPQPQPTKKQQQPTKKQQQQPQQKQAMQTQPNLTMPQDTTTTPSYEGRSTGVQRPAGITRSGANDDFARGVIRALRKTMPQMNVLGRVTVKLLINLNGNIESVEVVARSENTDLNRAIVFSTKQASFPFPPNGATTDDRTFTITYIYH